MRSFNFFFLIIFFVFNHKIISQELNAQVIVNSNLVNQTNQQIFQTLEKSLNEFLNNQSWTNKEFLSNEKITCSFIFTLSSYKNDKFEGTLQVQSQRPVFDSNYDSPVLNFLDKDIEFKYQEFQPLFFNKSSFESNLVSIVSYYSFLIIGLDMDTFKLNGGSFSFDNAQTIVNLARQSGFKGWNPNESDRNRFWLIESILSNSFNDYRKSLYIYHKKGLDFMTNNNFEAKISILESINNLEKVYNVRPDSYLLQIFFDAKANEIVNIFSGGPKVDFNSTLSVLKKISPFFNSKWKQIKM
mgnify:FL=1|tara:strand:+ start:1106 stop:2002 length:897 start_codon:yes stop_codon:yes gene_type:complete